MSPSRKHSHPFGPHSQRRQRVPIVSPDYLVSLDSSEREYYESKIAYYLQRSSPNDQERLIRNLSSEKLLEIIQRSHPKIASPKKLGVKRQAIIIFDNLNRLDEHLTAYLFEEMVKDLRTHFDELQMSSPDDSQFGDMILFLRQIWSRAAVNAYIAHLARSSVTAQPLAIEYLQAIEENQLHEDAQELSQIEFPIQLTSTEDKVEIAASIDTLEDSFSEFTEQSQILDLDAEPLEKQDGPRLTDESNTVAELHESESEEESNSNPSFDLSAKELGEQVEQPLFDSIEAPDIDDIIYTPLGRMLIKQAIAASDGRQLGALSSEDYVLMLEEFLSLNNEHRLSWFIAGFSTALGLYANDSILESSSINSWRKQQYYWGYIKGLERNGRRTEIQKVCAEEWPNLLELLRDGDARDVLISIAQAVIYSNIEQSEDLLGLRIFTSATEIEREIALIQMLDSESVNMLRAMDATRAEVVLNIADTRRRNLLAHQKNLSERHIIILHELGIGLRMGRAACFRIVDDFISANQVLDEVSEDNLVACSSRTRARFYIQKVLSKSKTKRIEDVLLPRSIQEENAFKRSFAPYLNFIEQARNASYKSSDAYYLLGGLQICEGNYETASSLLGQARLGYTGRPDREYILPHLILRQNLLQFHLDSAYGILESTKEIIENAHNWKLQKEEVGLIVDAISRTVPNTLDGFLSWLSQQRHEGAVLKDKTLRDCFELSPQSFEPILKIGSWISNQDEKLHLFITLLTDALIRNHDAHIEAALDQIDHLLEGHSEEAHTRWAEFCRENEAYRNYLGKFDADLAAINSVRDLWSAQRIDDLIIEIIDGMLPVNTLEEESNLSELIERLSPTSHELADVYREDPQTKAPTTYQPVQFSKAASSAHKDSPVNLIFVGGNPGRQEGINEEVQSALQTKYGDAVNVYFVVPGWGSNWSDCLERIENRLPTCDAIVTMHLTRTNFGRTLRRKLNPLNVPRIALTSEGKTSSLRAIENAISVAKRLRQHSLSE